MKRTTFTAPTRLRGAVSQVNLFAVPLLVFEWPEAAYWRDELIEAVEKRRRRSKGIVVSNVGGWHSKSDLPRWPEPAARNLVRWAAAMTTQASAGWRQNAGTVSPKTWRMTAWANVNPPHGARNFSHHHATLDFNWSATYYLRVPKPPDGAEDDGAIVFEDKFLGLDTAAVADAERRIYRYVPSEGELVMFPSWLYHRVAPHAGDGDRMSIAMNMHSPWLERSRFWTHRRGFMWRNLPWLMRPVARLHGSWDQSARGAPPGYDVEPEPTYL